MVRSGNRSIPKVLTLYTVYMSALITLERLRPKGQVKRFGPDLRWGLFEQVLRPLGLYNQTIVPMAMDQATEVNGEWPDGHGAQLVILGTCEIE
jgi:hypothetical protein